MSLVVGILLLIIVLLVLLLVLAHYHLMGLKIDNAIAGLEARLHIATLLSKIGVADATTPAAPVAPAVAPPAPVIKSA